MKNNNFAEVYLDIDEKIFKSVEKRAKQDSIDRDPNDTERKNHLLFENAKMGIDEIYIEDKSEELYVCGMLQCFGSELGWISLTIPLNQEIAKDIIEKYIKKLQKLKTVIEATKD